MYMYHNRKNFWDIKILATGIFLGVLVIVFSSWAEIAVEHTFDYHLDIPNHDRDNEDRAREDSKSDGPQGYIDSKGDSHVFVDGKEVD